MKEATFTTINSNKEYKPVRVKGKYVYILNLEGSKSTIKPKLVGLLQVDITGRGDGGVLSALSDHIITLGGEGGKELVEVVGLHGVARFEKVVMLFQGHKGSLEITVAEFLHDNLNPLVVDGDHHIKSKEAPDGQINSSRVLLQQPGVYVFEPIGPELAQTDQITVLLFTFPGPENLLEVVLLVLLHKADPLVENGELGGIHVENLKPMQ